MVHANPQPPRSAKEIASDITKGIEDAAETLRWCKQHLHERRAADALRLVQLNLACIAIALDWQMEGELAKAEAALDRVWWQPHRDDIEPLDTTVAGH
jgi:hypothetical protein